MIKISILFGHYSEDKERENTARKCLISASKQRNRETELIIIFNGIYPYRDEFITYCDQWHEREADIFPGKTFNIGVEMAKGESIFYMSNDAFLKDGAVAESARLLQKYPQYIITPLHANRLKSKRNKLLVDGYYGNDRIGDLVGCMSKKHIQDIGRMDEVCYLTDMINYTNRRIAKGYTVMMTKDQLAFDMAPNIHSFKSQIKKYGYRGYKHEKPIYSQEELKKVSYI